MVDVMKAISVREMKAQWSEVEAQVREILTTQTATRLAEERAKAAAERIKKGEDFKAVAKASKLAIVTPPDFSINDSIEGLGTASYLADAFTKPVGTILGPTVVQGRTVIARVTGKTPANMAALGAEHDTMLNEIKRVAIF